MLRVNNTSQGGAIEGNAAGGNDTLMVDQGGCGHREYIEQTKGIEGRILTHKRV